MRSWRIAAIAATMVALDAAPASADVPVPAGLGSGFDTGSLPRAAAQPGTPERTSPTAAASIGRQSLKFGRIATLFDYFPAGGGGDIRSSAGLRRSPKPGRGGLNPYRAAAPSSLIDTPVTAGASPFRNPLRRDSPALTAAWTGAVKPRLALGPEAGTAFDRGDGRAYGAAATQRWSRIDPLARAPLARRF